MSAFGSDCVKAIADKLRRTGIWMEGLWIDDTVDDRVGRRYLGSSRRCFLAGGRSRLSSSYNRLQACVRVGGSTLARMITRTLEGSSLLAHTILYALLMNEVTSEITSAERSN